MHAEGEERLTMLMMKKAKGLLKRKITRAEAEDVLAELLRLTVGSQPNLNILSDVLRDMKAIRLNVKNFGYLLARELRDGLLGDEPLPAPPRVGLKSKLTTQSDMESSWVRYWCNRLRIKPIYHRKIWELCYVAQAVHEYCNAEANLAGIGFGCGEEPLPSLFASLGHRITVTDLEPEKVQGLGWAETGQHTTGLDKVFFGDIVDKPTFVANVDLQYVDMNHIPDELSNRYDYCWSVCALEHLGSIANGLEFIKNSLKVLKPGGVAVHTTEYNYTNEPETLDHWNTVLFKREHFENLRHELAVKGYDVIEFDFDAGNGVLDRFIDIPPYGFGEGWLSKETWGDANQNAHLKLSVDGFPCTCIGIMIRKP